MTALDQAPRATERFDITHYPRDLHAVLVKQRRFRVDQLRELDTAAAATSASASDEPRNAVAVLVRAAATAALADIDAALKRMELSCYGRCQSCNTPITAERLKVLPAVRLCMPCQFAQETSPSGRRSPASGQPSPRPSPYRSSVLHVREPS